MDGVGKNSNNFLILMLVKDKRKQIRLLSHRLEISLLTNISIRSILGSK